MAERKNVLGGALADCSQNPLTGFYRDGCCHAGDDDLGVHAVCSIMTDDFLAFSKESGNDLSTPNPSFGFPGLKAGDRWCVCAARWKEAFLAGSAPKVVLSATGEAALEIIKLEELTQHALDLQ